MTSLVNKIHAFRPWLYEKWQNDKGLFYVMLEQGIMSGSNFLTSLLVFNSLGNTLFGAYSLILSVVYILGGFHSSVVVSGVIHQLSLINNTQEYQVARQVIIFKQLLFLLVSFLFITLAFQVYQWTGTKFNFNEVYFPSLFLVATHQLQELIRKLYINGKRYKTLVFSSLISYFPQLAVLLFFLITHCEITINTVLIVFSVTTLAALIFGFLSLNLYKRVIVENLGAEIQKTLTLSFSLSITTIVSSLTGFLSSLLYSHFLGLALYGSISFLGNIFGPFNIIRQAFNNYLTPKINVMLKSRSALEMNQYLKKRMLLLVGMTIIYGAAALITLVLIQNYFGYLNVDAEINQLAYIVLMTLFVALCSYVGTRSILYLASKMYKVILIESVTYHILNLIGIYLGLLFTRSFELPMFLSCFVLVVTYYIREKWLVKNYMKIKVKLSKPVKQLKEV